MQRGSEGVLKGAFQVILAFECLAMPLATTEPPLPQYVFILTWKPDGSLAMALFGGFININDFAVAVERVLHQVYSLEGASKSFHLDFESYDSVLKTLGIECMGSCFNCCRLGKIQHSTTALPDEH